MSFRVPGRIIDSNDDDSSFHSQEVHVMPDQQYEDVFSGENDQNMSGRMSGLQMPQDHTNQESHQAEPTSFSNIPPTIYQAICDQVTRQILSQLQNNQQVNPPSQNIPPIHTSSSQPLIPINYQKSSSKWPMWDGSPISFDAHMFSLRVKIEEDRQFLGSDRSICLNIFNSIPTIKQPRIMQWYRLGGPDRNHNWESFLHHIIDQLENKQARQTARSQLQRMRMGPNQLFIDFLQDFELKISQCDCIHWSDDMKISLLENSINSTLKTLLLSKSLPDDDYSKWIYKVKRVASRLENTLKFQQKEGSGQKTWYLPQGGSSRSFPPEQSRNLASPEVDADGDTNMGGVNTMKIAQAVCD